LQIFVSFALLIVAALADTKKEDIEATVDQNDFTVNDESGYKFGYKTSNNIKVVEEGDGQKVVEGSYSYVDDEGKTRTITYVAGDGIGFSPSGDGIHPEVLAAIELNLKNPPQTKEEAAKYGK